MTIHIAVASRNAGLDAALDRADAGPGPATIEVRTGLQPATADAAETGTVLVIFVCAAPAWAEAADGTKALNTDPALSAEAIETGVAGWARMKDSTGAPVLDVSVGTSSAEFLLNSTSITTGQAVDLFAGAITDPA